MEQDQFIVVVIKNLPYFLQEPENQKYSPYILVALLSLGLTTWPREFRGQFLQCVPSCCISLLQSVRKACGSLIPYQDKDVSVHSVPCPTLELAPSLKRFPAASSLPSCKECGFRCVTIFKLLCFFLDWWIIKLPKLEQKHPVQTVWSPSSKKPIPPCFHCHFFLFQLSLTAMGKLCLGFVCKGVCYEPKAFSCTPPAGYNEHKPQ